MGRIVVVEDQEIIASGPIHVLMLTAKGDESDLLVGLAALLLLALGAVEEARKTL